MATTQVTRTLDGTPDALWRCVRAFGDLSWIPGNPKVEIRGEGVGQVRIIERPYGKVHERLTSLDDDARSLTYVVPEGNPFPVVDYEARMTVADDGGKGRLTWSCRFEPDGVSEEEVARGLRKRFRAVIDLIEAHVKRGSASFFMRYGVSRTGDPGAPLVIEPYPEVCRGGVLRATVLAAAVDMVGSLFARESAGRDGIFTIDLSVRAPARPAPKRIVAHGELLRAGRSLIASEAVLDADGAAFGYGQTTFQRVPRPGSSSASEEREATGLPEVLAHVPLERPLAEEAGVVVVDASGGRVELPLGAALLSPQGVMQGALVALVVEEAALALAEHGEAGLHVVTELDVRYLAAGRQGPMVSSAHWVAGREGGMIRITLCDAGRGNRITTAALARVAKAAWAREAESAWAREAKPRAPHPGTH